MRNIIVLAVCFLLALLCGVSYGIAVVGMLSMAFFGFATMVTLIIKGIRSFLQGLAESCKNGLTET